MTQEEDCKTSNGGGDHSHNDGNDLMNSESRTPLKTPTKDAEVKFIKVDSYNGDAKIDMDHVKPGFSGLSKEELLKYVNDPFWVRVRTILFVLFWLIWVGLFVAAIAIIVMAPRCKVASPRKWYQEGPLINVKLPKDGKSLVDVAEKINYLSELKVKGLILSPVYPTDVNGDAIDFKSVSKDYGTFDDLKKLLEAAKKKAIRILLNLIPNHSSLDHEWFKKSVAREAPFDSYYVWAEGKSGTDGTTYPNNWKSIDDKAAWTLNPTRNEYYLHQLGEGKPDLNFHNPLVKKEIVETLNFWLSAGISGFSFEKVQYLLEDHELKNEEIGGTPGFSLNQYGFWSHAKTHNYDGTAELLSSWQNLTHEATSGDGIIVINGEVPIAANMNQTSSPDLVRVGAFSEGLKSNINAEGLNKLIEQKGLRAAGASWPAIETVQTGQHLKELGEAVIDPLNMISMLLPGTPITQFGDEQGFSNEEARAFLANKSSDVKHESDDPTSHYHIYRTLSHARDSHSILYGAIDTAVINNTFVLARSKTGYPGFVAVWNSSPTNLTIDLSPFASLPRELTVVASGDAIGSPINTRVSSDKISLPPNTATVYTFVPEG